MIISHLKQAIPKLKAVKDEVIEFIIFKIRSSAKKYIVIVTYFNQHKNY